jgi:hypothetical protein
MGTCWSCDKQVTLQEGQNKCDSCGEILFYRCWFCKNQIDVIENMPTCKTCGYYYCPTCGICGERCDKLEWCSNLKKILPDASPEQLRAVINLIETCKISNERKECINHVPITYAKGRIKSLLVKVEGFRVKSEADRAAFIKRVDELTEVPIGTKMTISKIRDAGSYGQEYRDALNLMVCMGKMQIKWIPATEDKPEYALYERIEQSPCCNLSRENLIINECPKCKKQYPKDITQCSCIYQKGKNKGTNYQLKKRVNNCDTCQMYRGDFTK